jgi:hypothetical protein
MQNVIQKCKIYETLFLNFELHFDFCILHFALFYVSLPKRPKST